MTLKTLTITKEGEEQPYVQMENISETCMHLKVFGNCEKGDPNHVTIHLSRQEAQDLAKVLDDFSFNYLEDKED